MSDRLVLEFEQGTGQLLRQILVPVSPAEEIAEGDAREGKDQLLSLGRQAVANWSTLTPAQKDRILLALLRYVLWRES